FVPFPSFSWVTLACRCGFLFDSFRSQTFRSAPFFTASSRSPGAAIRRPATMMPRNRVGRRRFLATRNGSGGGGVGAVRTVMLYLAAVALVTVMLPAAVVAWYAASPDPFGTALHAAVELMSPAPSADAGSATPQLAEAAADPAVEDAAV